MIKRIRIILILVFVSMLGVVLLQVYWIRQSYQINKEQLQKELNLALEKSVKVEMNERMNGQAEIIFRGENAAVMTVKKDSIPNVKMDSLLNKVFNSQDSGRAEFTMHINSVGVSGDNIDSIPEKFEFRIKEMVASMLSSEMSGGFKANIQRIDSLFTNELLDREIELPYNIEQLTRQDSTFVSSTSISYDTINSLKTRSFQTDIMGNERLRVRILNEQEVILERMLTGVLASLILILFVLICFIYMLLTIFKQKKLSQIKSDFINNMTHELKTPIATVSAIVESMQSFGVLDDNEKTQKYLTVSQTELGRLSGLVEKVLNMAREEREPLQMHIEELNFREICDNIINSQKMKQEEKEVSFDLKIDEEAERLKVDRFHMVNVMQNLIENSIKYSGNPVHIKIECQRKPDFIQISVSDNGNGIHKKHQAKVFDQFYRVPTGDVHNVKGFGLGLHYVRNIIEKHSGKIGLSSEAGRGSTFTINLPC